MKRNTTQGLCGLLAATAIGLTSATAADNAGKITAHSDGLHGYIGFSHDRPPAGSGYRVGMGSYAAGWPLIDQPLAGFQIGLPSSWGTLRYGPPKFSLNATPQCYDYEVGSPGWSFFYDNEALPDHRLGIAQLSNRLLIPPDALPFRGIPNGEFLGYTWMALPFTEPTTGDPPRATRAGPAF
jgi:hypothetical protein